MSSAPLLELDGLTVGVGGSAIASDINLTIHPGETHVLLGPNGSGKSTLLRALMGIGPFSVMSGHIRLDGADITEASATQRARAGLGMALQQPPDLAGVSVRTFAAAMGAADRVNSVSGALQLEQLVDRDVNRGFSGGEVKRWEVMKLLLQRPKMCLFDEPESGVDLEHVRVVGEAIRSLLSEADSPRGALIITHTGLILDHIPTTIAHLMMDGRIVREGSAGEMLKQIRAEGYVA